eukprot:c17598_g1_i2 orf=167-439(+)
MIEIKRVLESVYGLEVAKVNTLNMDGKRRRLPGGWLLKKPDYKKAYVVLRNPISLPDNLFPFNWLKEQEKAAADEKKLPKRGRRKENGAS